MPKRWGLPPSQKPRAGQEPYSAPAGSHLPAAGYEYRADRQSWRWQDFPGQDLWLESLSGQSARFIYHRHGYAESPAGFAGRPFAGAQVKDVYRAHTFASRRARL